MEKNERERDKMKREKKTIGLFFSRDYFSDSNRNKRKQNDFFFIPCWCGFRSFTSGPYYFIDFILNSWLNPKVCIEKRSLLIKEMKSRSWKGIKRLIWRIFFFSFSLLKTCSFYVWKNQRNKIWYQLPKILDVLIFASSSVNYAQNGNWLFFSL